MDQQTWTTQLRELKQLGRYTRMPEAHVEGRDRFIRFLDSYSTDAQLDPIVDSLCMHFGLYTYMPGDRSGLSTSEALAVDFHRPASSSRADFIFHEEQAAIFYRILDGKNVILSAPTSFGKSVILDALVASRRWHNIVVIVPTVALNDEVRRRLVPFVDRYNVITHPSQAPGEDNIYAAQEQVPDQREHAGMGSGLRSCRWSSLALTRCSRLR